MLLFTLINLSSSMLVLFSDAHVSLTYPQARSPPLDFLDTARTMEPCGVPRPNNPKQTLLFIGQQYNFTWTLQYPHKGGFRLSLIDEKNNLVQRLLPTEGEDKFYGSDHNQTSQSAMIKITKSCDSCSILLERQALEWGATYGFKSCADVTVISRVPNDLERCSYNGQFENGIYHCSNDTDCLNDGKCVTEFNSLIRRTCFCAFGYFGPNCDRSFKPKGIDKCFNFEYSKNEDNFDKYGLFNGNCYKKFKLNNDDYVYSRVIEDEVEIIMDYASNSWISIGWRPVELDPSCRLFPDLENGRFKRSSTSENNASIVMNSDSSTVDADSDRLYVPMPKLPKTNGFVEAALHAPLHPMDCTDIVIGSVEDGRSRINDMYTRDRSTPLSDTWLDGEESFSAAYGIERDGRTIVMFRRRIAEIEPSDHPLGPGVLYVIHAKGQDEFNYSHAVDSAIENITGGSRNFYKNDHVKYHGNKNRGSQQIEFVSLDERPSRKMPQFVIEHDEEIPRKQTTIDHSKGTHSQTNITKLPGPVEIIKTDDKDVRITEQASNTNRNQTTTKMMTTAKHEIKEKAHTDLDQQRHVDYFYFDNSSTRTHSNLYSLLLIIILCIFVSKTN